MLLSLFNILAFGLEIVIIFCDFPHIVDVIWFCIVLFPAVIDALIRSLIYKKRLFKCKNCGEEFQQKWSFLFGKFAPWKLPRRIQNGVEAESCLYGKAWITCPSCDSWDCFVDMTVTR